MASPPIPTALSVSPRNSDARTATVMGWLSMMTEPSPADVFSNPSARKPCSIPSDPQRRSVTGKWREKPAAFEG